LVALSATDGLEILKKEHVDLILTDQRMPEMDGVEFLKQALSIYPDLNRILITAYSDFDALRNAINEAQIFQYIQKPWSEDNLRFIIEQALEVYQIKQKNEELSRQLEEKNEQLQKINIDLLEFEKLKSEFLATISHEIRTPLNGLKGPLDLLKEEINLKESEKLENLFFILENSVNRLEQFALSAERITWLKAEKYKLEPESLHADSILTNVFEILDSSIKKKQINFHLELDKFAVFFGDRELITTCIKIIIENAVKYSYEKGLVDIKTFRKDQWVVMEIKDYGIGFDEKAMKHVFKLFTKGAKYLDQNIGLDLAIAKLIIDAHKGEIEIENNTEKGASVRIFFSVEMKYSHVLN
ncbi:MAG: hypothetical protein A2491_03250, partial [Bacteroidetes bacterium RIFOXYC12_FULL_35_7]